VGSPPERELVQRAFAFSDQTAGEVMVPRTEIVALPAHSTVQEAVRVALRYRHSRFPVYEQTIDNVVGILSTKDLLSVAARRGTRSTLDETTFLRRLIRPPVIVPQGAPVTEVLARMKAARQPMAVVLDEFGGTAGLVTLEDVIEQLVGEVHDEFDSEAPAFKEEAPGTFVVDGLTSLDALRERLGVELTDEPYDTVGGLVVGRLGRLAAVGDTIEVEGYKFQVTAVDGRRVAQVRVVGARPPRKAA
jgi:putative hemolysin